MGRTYLLLHDDICKLSGAHTASILGFPMNVLFLAIARLKPGFIFAVMYLCPCDVSLAGMTKSSARE